MHFNKTTDTVHLGRRKVGHSGGYFLENSILEGLRGWNDCSMGHKLFWEGLINEVTNTIPQYAGK